MPFDLSIDVASAMVVVTHRGLSSREECDQVLAMLASDRRIEPSFGVLIDVRLIEYEPTFEDLRALGGMMAARLQNRIAFVVATPLQFGVSRQSGAFGELGGAQIDVFYEYLEAVGWLTGHRNGGHAATA